MKEKKVVLSTRQSTQNQLFSILHECGHLLIRSNKKKYKAEYPLLNKFEENETSIKPLRFFIEETKEEILAWDKGWKLARQMKFIIEEKKYRHYAATCVMTYMAVATEGRKWILK